MKYLYVKFSDNKWWRIPVEVIAKNRATYYAERDEDRTFKEEFDYVMSDNYEIADWAFNNMDWKDLEPHAELDTERFPEALIDYHEEWPNPQVTEIIEVED